MAVAAPRAATVSGGGGYTRAMIKRIALAIVLLGLLTACGNKGPLVMPDAPAAEPAADTPATDPAQPPAGSETDGTPPATTP